MDKAVEDAVTLVDELIDAAKLEEWTSHFGSKWNETRWRRVSRFLGLVCPPELTAFAGMNSIESIRGAGGFVQYARESIRDDISASSAQL